MKNIQQFWCTFNNCKIFHIIKWWRIPNNFDVHSIIVRYSTSLSDEEYPTILMCLQIQIWLCWHGEVEEISCNEQVVESLLPFRFIAVWSSDHGSECVSSLHNRLLYIISSMNPIDLHQESVVLEILALRIYSCLIIWSWLWTRFSILFLSKCYFFQLNTFFFKVSIL